MKILNRIILLLAVGASVASCSKDDETYEEVSGNKYETTYAKITASYNGAEQTMEFDTVDELKENDLYLKVEFKSDNTFWVYEMIDYENETYDWMQAGTWSQKDSKITVTFDGETITLTADGSKLIMTIDLDEMYSKKLGINEEEPTGTIEWHFSKI